jgi:hypothetical protein
MKSSRLKIHIILYITASFLLLFAACGSSGSGQSDILFDFEHDNQLDLFTWKCPSMFSISKQWAAHGKSSLKFEFYPAEQIGFSSGTVKRDWSRSRGLAFSLYNPSSESTDIYIRISDDITQGNGAKAFVSKLEIRPGENTLRLPLKSLQDSSGRPLNLKDIRGIYIYKKNVQTKKVLFFDYFRVEKTLGSHLKY